MLSLSFFRYKIFILVKYFYVRTLYIMYWPPLDARPYLRIGWFVWHGTKGTWIETMWDPLYDLGLWFHPWLWSWIFKVKFWNSYISGMGGLIDMEQKGYEIIGCWTHYMTLTFDPQPWAWPWIFKVKIWHTWVSGMDGSVLFESIDIKAT